MAYAVSAIRPCVWMNSLGKIKILLNKSNKYLKITQMSKKISLIGAILKNYQIIKLLIRNFYKTAEKKNHM